MPRQDVRKTQTPTSASIVASGTAAANMLSVNTAAVSDVTFDITGTFVGTISFEGTIDGTNFASIAATACASTTSTTRVVSATAPAMFTVDATPYKSVRARCSAYTSGTIVVKGARVIR